jgi:formylglycine-generating enzyme required for sulfatase activity
LLPGQDWELELSAAVRASDAVIVCLSAASVEKAGYVQKELRLVLEAAEYQPEGRIFVVPVRLEECTLPLRLSRWQYADLFVEDGYQRLKAALTARAGGRDAAALLTPLSSSETQPIKASTPRRWFTVLAAALLTTIAGAALYRIVRPTPPITSPVSPSAPSKSPQAPEPAGMVFIPGGRFLMGRNDRSDPEASPAHEVTLSAFHLDRAPVTAALFRDFLKSTGRPSTSPEIVPGGDRAPATRVTWDEADAYCLAQGKRLPSEEEWEFAARGPDGRLYPWGESFDADAVNTSESGLGRPEPVEGRLHNISPFGVADMSGNVWQWCSDDYRPYPGGSSASIPHGAKVIRGGSYSSDRMHVTAVTRNLELPSTRSPAIGFRCAK